MATTSKFDLSADSPDRPVYGAGQRGLHVAAQLDRSGSFRDSMQNPILSSLPNMARSSGVAQADVMNFFQCLRFDPKVVAAEHKSNRQGDFKRLVNVALGLSPDDSSISSKGKILSPPSPDEIKRIRNNLRESVVKGRERMKIFNEALSVFNKFFPSIPSKKRSRLESHYNDRTNALLSSDRPTLGPTSGKLGAQNRAGTSSFEHEQHKSEEQIKGSVPNKRTRTSLVDTRSSAFIRSSGAADKDRERLKLANSGIEGEDRSLSIGVDGWEKTKMKKRRSGIKPDVSPNAVSNKLTNGYRELKQGLQQRPVADTRSRPNNDLQLRPGVANGPAAVGKSDGALQSTGLRSSIPGADQENDSLLNSRRECPISSDKDKVNTRAVHKENVHDDFSSASPTSSTKNTGVRAPRSGSGVVPKSSLVAQRTNAPNDWDISSCSNKPPIVGGNNRKRSASNRSSSPPVAHWAGQRPQKISRMARRTNFMPVIPNNEESPLDSISDVSGNELGLGIARRMTADSPQQVKSKGDHISSAALSESEESAASEIKSRDKSKKSDETDDKAVQNIQKISTLGQQSRKNKIVSGEELGDGIRRQGRSGRGLISTRSLMPMAVEKHGNVGTAKQLKSARNGLEKNESKPGRPPTRKLSDRKACSRQKHTAVNTASDVLVGSDIGHEELLAAATSVINSDHALSSSFWRQMESFFRFLTDSDICYLKQQGTNEFTSPVPALGPPYASAFSNGPIENGLSENDRPLGLATGKECFDLPSKNLMVGSRDSSLCQRLLAAIIPEEDCDRGNGDMGFEADWTGFELDQEFELNGSNLLNNYQFSGHHAFNGYKFTGGPEYHEAEIDMLGASNTNISSKFGGSANGMLSNQMLVSGLVCSEVMYDNEEINEKILLEVQSIGIFAEEMSDMPMEYEEIEISRDISKLEEKYCEQISRKKGFIDKLIKLASEAKDNQKRVFEQCAYNKLVTVAYQKYMTCRRPNGTSGKSSNNKMAKQAALTFVKQTLERCHKFEDMGDSCFSEPIFRDMFLNAAPSVDASMDRESGRSGTVASHPSPQISRLGQSGDGRVPYSSDLLPSVNHLTEQNTCKEDMWLGGVKKKEILIGDVIGGSLSSSTKGKRSERDRDGSNKVGRPAVSSAKGERKSRTKSKHKTTQLSASVNGLIGKIPDQLKSMLPSEVKPTNVTTENNAEEKDGFGLSGSEDAGVLDLSHLPLPEMDVLGDDQGQDFGSWLNFDDDGLQDHGDFMGLEIPMDDLSDLNMMV